MVIIAATVLGFMKADIYRERIKELRNLQLALNMLSSEISYTATPVPLAFKKIGSRVDKPISLFFLRCSQLLEESPGEDFADLWQRAVKENYGNTALEKSDQDLLLTISTFLGVSDQYHQEKQINLVLHQLDHTEKEALDDMNKNERMWKYLGVMGGLMLVILLI